MNKPALRQAQGPCFPAFALRHCEERSNPEKQNKETFEHLHLAQQFAPTSLSIRPYKAHFQQKDVPKTYTNLVAPLVEVHRKRVIAGCGFCCEDKLTRHWYGLPAKRYDSQQHTFGFVHAKPTTMDE